MTTRIERSEHGTPRRDRRRGQHGFSSVEILLATAVTLTLMGSFAAVNHFQLGTLRDEAKRLRARGSGRSVTDLFAREARRADAIELLPDVNGLRISSDLNRNGTTDAPDDSPDEDVLYGLYDGALWRKSGGPNSSSPWEQLGGNQELTGVQWFFRDRSGEEISYAAAQALPAEAVAGFRRVGLRLNPAPAAGADPTSGHRVRLASDSTLRKRFFVGAIGDGVNDAIYQPFDATAFVAGLGPGNGSPGAPPPPQPTPVPTTEPTEPSEPPPPPTAAPTCLERDAPCTLDEDCCSDNCRGNGRCN